MPVTVLLHNQSGAYETFDRDTLAKAKNDAANRIRDWSNLRYATLHFDDATGQRTTLISQVSRAGRLTWKKSRF